MTSVIEYGEQLRAAVKTVEGLRVYEDPSATVRPPAAVVGPPRLQWEAGCPGPTSATFIVIVMVALDKRAVEQLLDLVPKVADAIDEQVIDAAVISADPAIFNAGGTDLPSYELTVEVSL